MFNRRRNSTRILLVLFCLSAFRVATAQDADAELTYKQFSIVFKVDKSSVDNLAAADQQALLKASFMGMAPPTFGFFDGTLNGERHWKFSCKAENTRYEQNPCIDMPIGTHRARWVHNRELLEVFAYAADGSSVSLRYIDVTIDSKNPPPPDDPVQSLPAYPGFFTISQEKQTYPLLVHVYGAVSLSFQLGQLPARTNCDVTVPTPNRANVNCRQYPPIPINQGMVAVQASIDGHMVNGMSCDAKWRWSKCSVVGPGFYSARWKNDRRSEIILLGLRNSKTQELGFEVRD
jgi:hypothetical protein